VTTPRSARNRRFQNRDASIPDAAARRLDRDLAVAVLVTEDNRYLLQLRDDLPGVSLRGHWGLFGGGLESGETPELALRREIQEELGVAVRQARLLTQIEQLFDMAALAGLPDGPFWQRWRLHFYAVPILAAEVDGMQQTEGAGRALFSIEEILRLEKIGPWDLGAVLAHAHGATLFAHWLSPTPPRSGSEPLAQ
jgi:8-oxo-dGTP pyrophosphatase MutT (NUDIX family)